MACANCSSWLAPPSKLINTMQVCCVAEGGSGGSMEGGPRGRGFWPHVAGVIRSVDVYAAGAKLDGVWYAQCGRGFWPN
eukprot:9122289-Pyramimonas_sp.AAC.1